MQTQLPIKRALLSVSDKTGVVEFASQLVELGIEILATGGTAELLKKNNIPVIDIAEYTGFPEIMNGRVKTLHPKIYGGLLARRGIDETVLQQNAITPIDLLVVNLYPFATTIAQPNCTFAQAIEQIDIGGPAMLRAAAKNHKAVTVIVDPKDYSDVLQAMQKNKNATTEELRLKLAKKVFIHTANYDKTIANYFAKQAYDDGNSFPEIYQPTFKLQEALRYGENPHQKAAFYQDINDQLDLKLIQGKALSYNNMLDADCALQCVQELDSKQAVCVIVKHATPCGVGQDPNIINAYQKAYCCDPESAFGGIIAFNQSLTADVVNTILTQQFLEVVLAPNIDKEALEVLITKPNLRVLIYTKQQKQIPSLNLRSIAGGVLVQEQDHLQITPQDIKVVTERQPSPNELNDLLFAWHVVKFTKSNAIVFAKNGATLGIGCGQTSRVFAVKIAALRAQAAHFSLNSAALASDAFFPFADSIQLAAQYGISAIIQPGGSKRDHEVIAAANQANIAMLFTGIRHFRH